MVIYYVDSMQIISKIPSSVIKDLIDIDELSEECCKFYIKKASKVAFRAGFKSTICITAPTKRLFKLLAYYDLGDYKISYMEIAEDVIKTSMSEAILKSYSLKKTMIKKYALNPYCYDTRDTFDKIRLRLETGLFSDLTSYLGSNIIRYVVYARISKINNQPCIHSEWRFRGAYNIRKKTGISTIEDCINFDFRQVYEETTSKYIYHAEIDHNKLGKYLKGYDGRRKSYTKRQLIGIGIAAITFISAYAITSTAELVNTIKRLKEEIKSNRGRRNKFQQMILSIKSDCMFNIPISIE